MQFIYEVLEWLLTTLSDYVFADIVNLKTGNRTDNSHFRKQAAKLYEKLYAVSQETEPVEPQRFTKDTVPQRYQEEAERLFDIYKSVEWQLEQLIALDKDNYSCEIEEEIEADILTTVSNIKRSTSQLEKMYHPF